MKQVNGDSPVSSSGLKSLASLDATKQFSKQQENNLLELTEYDKFMLVNRSKTVEDLIEAVTLIDKKDPITPGIQRWMSIRVIIEGCYYGERPYIDLLCKYGIRQQLMHIMYYEGRIHLL